MPGLTSSPSRCSPSPPITKKRAARENLPRDPLAMIHSNGESGSSHRRRASEIVVRPPRSPVRLDAGVDRSTIRPRSTSRPATTRSSPSVSYSAYQNPSSSAWRSTPLPDVFSPPPVKERLSRKPSRVFVGPGHSRSSSRSSQASRTRSPQRRYFQHVRQLPKGTFGTSFASLDQASGRVHCVRVFAKDKMRADGHLHTGLLTELLTYKHIAKQPTKSRTFLMELQAVLQNEESILFVMPLMQSDLLSVIQGPVDRSRTRRWVAQVALGIDALHTMGIIHRDIKPENILLDARTNNVRIADFNAAFLQPGDAPLENGAVYTREYAGSKPYLAPEVVQRRWYGKMVDWWSLGCVMFDLVSGELLFRDEAQRTKYAKWDAKKEGTSYLRWAADLTRDEEHVLLGLLHLSPKSRFQLAQLQRHRYFVDERGSNVFHLLGEQMHASPGTAALSLEKTPEIGTALKEPAPCAASPYPCQADEEGPYEFRDFAWVHPRGPWGSS